MLRAFSTVIAVVFTLLLAACGSEESHPPSKGAASMAGAVGTFEFKPSDWKKGETSYWKDTDGVDPGAAGCHVGTDADGNPNGRSFGEACLPGGILLVESNPGADVVHKHTNDLGHPDKFDCNAWCKGEGKSKGRCEAAPAPAPCTQSAKCVCQ